MANIRELVRSFILENFLPGRGSEEPDRRDRAEGKRHPRFAVDAEARVVPGGAVQDRVRGRRSRSRQPRHGGEHRAPGPVEGRGPVMKTATALAGSPRRVGAAISGRAGGRHGRGPPASPTRSSTRSPTVARSPRGSSASGPATASGFVCTSRSTVSSRSSAC